jgi:hypothetical protein
MDQQPSLPGDMLLSSVEGYLRHHARRKPTVLRTRAVALITLGALAGEIAREIPQGGQLPWWMPVLGSLAGLLVHLAATEVLVTAADCVAWIRSGYEKKASPSLDLPIDLRTVATPPVYTARLAGRAHARPLSILIDGTFAFVGVGRALREAFLITVITVYRPAVRVIYDSFGPAAFSVVIPVSAAFVADFRRGIRSDMSIGAGDIVAGGSRFVLIQALVPRAGSTATTDIEALLNMLPDQLTSAIKGSVRDARIYLETATYTGCRLAEQLGFERCGRSADGFPIVCLDMTVALSLNPGARERAFADRIVECAAKRRKEARAVIPVASDLQIDAAHFPRPGLGI